MITFISPLLERVFFFNWNLASSPYLEMLLINVIKLLPFFFFSVIASSMLLLVICQFSIWQKILEVFRGIYLNIIFWILIANVNFFSDLKFEYYCDYYPEILQQVSLKKETKIDERGHIIFSKKITRSWNI